MQMPLPARLRVLRHNDLGVAMHVYLREQPVDLQMREVEAEGLIEPDSGLIPMAFFSGANATPSFRAFLPPETVNVLHQVITGPVRLGLMAEEPEDPSQEIQAMVGLSIPVDELPEGMAPEEMEAEEGESEPWKAGAEGWRPDGWKDESGDADADDTPRTILLAFAPLVRIKRRHPSDFAEELADLLETALAGATKPSLEARVDRMLGL
jgi:hypothetical protein